MFGGTRAISIVSRSWSWRLRVKNSTTRAQLGQADDPLGREVPDVSDPVERQEVMHAQGLERDLAHHDELVVSLLAWEADKAMSDTGRVGPGAGMGTSGHHNLQQAQHDEGGGRETYSPAEAA